MRESRPYQNPNCPHTEPKISVIIPMYNSCRWIGNAIHSICNQTYTDIELLIIDDGSTDASIQICRQYAKSDSRIRIISIQNQGVSVARNIGIGHARGDFLFFMDADDELWPHSLETLVEIERSTNADIVAGGFLEAASRPEYPKRHEGKSFIFTNLEAINIALYQRHLLNQPWGILYRKSIFTSGERFKPGIRYEDLDAFYRFFEQAEKIAYTPEKLYFYRKYPDSFIRQFSIARTDVLDVTDRIVTYMADRHPELIAAAEDRRFSAHFNILLLLYSLNVNQPEIEHRCLHVIRKGRIQALCDKNVRIKNKIGALLSFGGRPILKFLSRLYH